MIHGVLDLERDTFAGRAVEGQFELAHLDLLWRRRHRARNRVRDQWVVDGVVIGAVGVGGGRAVSVCHGGFRVRGLLVYIKARKLDFAVGDRTRCSNGEGLALLRVCV